MLLIILGGWILIGVCFALWIQRKYDIKLDSLELAAFMMGWPIMLFVYTEDDNTPRDEYDE